MSTPLVRVVRLAGAFGALVLVLASCGGSAPTATPPAPTPTRAPATPTPPPATPTRPGATPTATAIPATPTATRPAPAPTPTATPGVPAPIVLEGKRGGTLQLRSLRQPTTWDSVDARDSIAFHTIGPMLNNLIWPDPYRDRQTLVGDTVERWQIGSEGREITFFLLRGIKFHDGANFTSKDVAYNIDRAWKPRSSTMNAFQTQLRGISKIETPDDLSVRVTLSAPSNSLLQVLGSTRLMMYPSHVPFPEKGDEFKKGPIGSGPFKFKSLDPSVKMEFVRNDAYFRPGLPRMDGIVFTNIADTASASAAFRAGRLDATNLDSSAVESQTEQLKRDQGFVSQVVTTALVNLSLSQRAPLTDARVREAISLAVDRQAIVTIWQQGRGNPYAAPLFPPEMGGTWGISTETMKTRPGFRPDKTADLTRAKELITQAGVDPSKFTLSIVVTSLYPVLGEVVDRSIVALGFKTKVEPVTADQGTERQLRGDFDLYAWTSSINFDDPSDYLTPLVVTGGAINFGKWSNPQLDRLLSEQDSTLDQAKRKAMLIDVQEMVLTNRTMIPLLWRTSFVGYMPWVKNYPKLPFIFSPWYRWEQVSLER